MGLSRSPYEGANALADMFAIWHEQGNVGPGFIALDGIVFVPGHYRKSGLMLRRMVHHKPVYRLPEDHQVYLRTFWEEMQCAIRMGKRDAASGAYAFLGQPHRNDIRVWDAGTYDYWPNRVAWADIPMIMWDVPGNKSS